MPEVFVLGALIAARVAGRADPGPFVYRNLGTMATIGRSAAVADFGPIQITGHVAWLLWGFVHIYLLNRLPQSACRVRQLDVVLAHLRPRRQADHGAGLRSLSAAPGFAGPHPPRGLPDPPGAAPLVTYPGRLVGERGVGRISAFASVVPVISGRR